MTYGEKCVSIPYGEDMQKLILALFQASKAKKDKTNYDDQLSLSGDETRISINCSAPENIAFVTVKNSNSSEVFTISNLKCAHKLLSVLRDVLPIGAFIDENQLDIASAFIECVKTCTDNDRNEISAIKSVNYVTEEILKKDPSLQKYKVKHLLKINKTDLSCIANIYRCVSLIKSVLNASKSLEKNNVPVSSSNLEIITVSNTIDTQNTNVDQTQCTSTNINSLMPISSVQQGQMIPLLTQPPMVSIQPSPAQKSFIIFQTVESQPPPVLLQKN